MDSGLVAVPFHAREVQQDREPSGALNEGADRGALEPQDQIAFPVSRHSSVLCLGGALADHDLGVLNTLCEVSIRQV